MPPGGAFAILTTTVLFLLGARVLVRAARRPSALALRLRMAASVRELGGAESSDGATIEHEGRVVRFGLLPSPSIRRQGLLLGAWTRDGDLRADGPDPDYRAPPAAPVKRARVVLRRETWTDKLGKALGINRELETGDAELDRRVLRPGDGTDAELTAALGGPRAHQAILRLFELGPTRVTINEREDVLVSAAYVRPATPPTTPAALAELARAVADVAEALPRFEGLVEPPSALVHGGGLVAGVTAAAFVGVAMTELMLGTYPLVDRRDLRPVGLGSLAAWMVALWIIARVVRGRPTSFRAFTLAGAAALVALPTLAIGCTTMLNGGVDASPATEHVTTVVAHDKQSRRHGMVYTLDLAPWRPGARSISVTVKPGFYATTPVGAPVRLATRRGALGWEWWSEIYAATEPKTGAP